MPFYVENALGSSLENPTPAELREFLDALDPDDEEHGAAWLNDEHDNSLEYSVDGTLVFSRGDGPSRHLPGVSKDRVIELWLALARGALDALEAAPWRPGVRSESQLARWRKEADELQHRLDREYYDSLGAERPDEPCQHDGCARGSVAQSVLCRIHHFEAFQGRPCPFSD